MKKIVVLFLVLILTLALPGNARAITYGQPDGEGHPYVGLVGFYDADGVWLWRCSGTLIAPTVILTAGHCTTPDAEGAPAHAQVWFDSQIVLTTDGSGYPDAGGVMGTPIPNPNYHGLIMGNTNDVGLVILDEPVTDHGYGVLPDIGYLDQLATKRGLQDVTFTAAGYGLNEVKPQSISLRTRYIGVSHLVSLRSALTGGYNVQTSNNPGNWIGDGKSGGTCFGDSGGPVFYSNTNIVVAVTSFGMNSNCKGTDYGYRVDTKPAQEFINLNMP